MKRLTKGRTAALFIALRAAGYTIKDTAALLSLDLRQAWTLAADHSEEIKTQTAFLSLKNDVQNG